MSNKTLCVFLIRENLNELAKILKRQILPNFHIFHASQTGKNNKIKVVYCSFCW